MKIAVIVAMRKELDLILAQIENYTETSIDNKPVYKGMIGNNEVIVMQCGIGKVNSALSTYKMIEREHPDLVINSGVAGGVDASMKIGDILIADNVTYHDVWCGPGTSYGAADGFPVMLKPFDKALDIIKEKSADFNVNIKFGLLCSGDKFISTPKEVSEIKTSFPTALGCDMESASIAQTCTAAKIPFMIIRVMSDMPGGGENISEYQNFWTEAPAKTFEVVIELIKAL